MDYPPGAALVVVNGYVIGQLEAIVEGPELLYRILRDIPDEIDLRERVEAS